MCLFSYLILYRTYIAGLISKDQSSTASEPVRKQKKIHPKLLNKEVSETESPRTTMFANIDRACALDSDSNIDDSEVERSGLTCANLAQPMSEVQNVSTTSDLTRAENTTKLSKKGLSVMKSSRSEMPKKDHLTYCLWSIPTRIMVCNTFMHYIHAPLSIVLPSIIHIFFESDCNYRYEVTSEGNTNY